MNSRGHKLFPVLLLCCIGAVVVGVAAAMPQVRGWWKPSATSPAATGPEPMRLVDGRENTFTLDPAVVQSLGVQTTPAVRANHPRVLHLNGNLNLHPERQVKVKPYVASEVREIGKIQAAVEPPDPSSVIERPLRFGDAVAAGQLLVVLWSRELGEKKNELREALVQYRIDEEGLRDKLAVAGSIPPQTLREAHAKVANERSAVNRVTETLRTWHVSDDEIEAISKEADRLRKGEPLDLQRTSNWGRVERRAPMRGTILERNVNVGETVDPSTVMFYLADLSRLMVTAEAYEEDLPAVTSLEHKDWTVRMQADPDQSFPGRIVQIGPLVDPTQRTVPIFGYVDNPDGRLRALQRVTIEIKIPPPADEVEIPSLALFEDGAGSFIIVSSGGDRPEYTLRRVAVARRVEQYVVLRNALKPDEREQGVQTVKPGELVVSSGVLELVAALKDLESSAHQ